jgi:DNA-binding transcriptional LysR family regulator
MDRLQAMTIFAAVCDAGGFAPAARRLGISPSVVTRRIAALERRLGVRLLHRTTRAVRLTDAGERYLEIARRVLLEVDEAEERARGDRERPRGRLVVTAPVVFGRLHVAPLLRDYLAEHADVSSELILNDRNLHLIDEGIDVAIRIGALEDSSLVARRLGETRFVVVASPGYLAQHGRPQRPADLREHHALFSAPFTEPHEWTFYVTRDRKARPERIALQTRFATNSADAAIDFALAGFGIARVLLYQVREHIAAGRLEVLLDAFEPAAIPIHAVYASARLLPAKVRTFVDFAAEHARWSFADARPGSARLSGSRSPSRPPDNGRRPQRPAARSRPTDATRRR